MTAFYCPEQALLRRRSLYPAGTKHPAIHGNKVQHGSPDLPRQNGCIPGTVFAVGMRGDAPSAAWHTCPTGWPRRLGSAVASEGEISSESGFLMKKFSRRHPWALFVRSDLL